MSFQDLLDNGLLTSNADLSALTIGVTLFIAFAIGIFIFQVYKKTYQSVVYTKSFNLSLVAMTLITALVIMAVTSNVVLSLGMVGALSIVRFRAAIKDPMDIVYMFWAIAAGIIVGAGFYTLGIIGSLVIGMIIYIMNNTISNDTPYMLLLSFDDESKEAELVKIIKSKSDKYFIKSKTVDHEVNLTIELRVKKGEMAFVNDLKSVASVNQAMLVSTSDYAA